MAAGSSEPRIEPEQQAQLERARQFAELVRLSSVTEVADDRTLTVTVGPGNTLTALELTRQALRHDPSRLSGLIIETIARATARLSEQLREAATGLGPGTDSDDLSRVVQGGLPDPATGEPDDIPVPEDFATLVALADEMDDDTPPMPAEWAGRVPEESDDGPMAKLKEMERAAVRQAARYAEVHEQLRDLTASASSAQDLVTATVGQDNRLHSLRFDPTAFRHGPKHLAGFVLSAIQQATAELSRLTADLLQDSIEPVLDIRALVEPHLPDDSDPTEGLTPRTGSRR